MVFSKRSITLNSLSAVAFSGALLLSSQNASALTFVLDFSSLNTSETIFSSSSNATTDAFDPTAFGFSSSDFNTITSSVLNSVTQDFRGYPTFGSNNLSSIPVGKELDIDFEIGSVFNAPTNNDTNYYFLKVGEDATNPSVNFLGHACVGCARDSSGNYNNFFNGALVGSVLTDNISTVNHIAGDLTQVTNLLAGTISHEIGHTLSLNHAGIVANPGESVFSILGTGAGVSGEGPASQMPNNQRLLDRAFSYDQIDTLTSAVGLRDVTAVPLPPSVYLFGFSLAMLSLMKRRKQSSV